MSEVDVLVVFSNRYHYGINLIDVEVVKTRFLFFFRLDKTVSACNRKQEIDKTQTEPNPCAAVLINTVCASIYVEFRRIYCR